MKFCYKKYIQEMLCACKKYYIILVVFLLFGCDYFENQTKNYDYIFDYKNYEIVQTQIENNIKICFNLTNYEPCEQILIDNNMVINKEIKKVSENKFLLSLDYYSYKENDYYVLYSPVFFNSDTLTFVEKIYAKGIYTINENYFNVKIPMSVLRFDDKSLHTEYTIQLFDDILENIDNPNDINIEIIIEPFYKQKFIRKS